MSSPTGLGYVPNVVALGYRAGKLTTALCWTRGVISFPLAWAFTLVYCTAFLLFTLLTMRLLSRALMAPAVHWWARISLGLCGVRVVLDNPSTLLDRRSRVVIINHPSTLDIMWGALIAPPASVYVGKRELMFVPGINIAWWALRFALLDRHNPRRAHETLSRLVKQMQKERLSVVMLPEGTRSQDGELQPFKKGAFHLALQAGVPIYPIVAAGAYALMPRHRLVPFPGTIRVRFLAPIETHQWTRATLVDDIDAVRTKMQLALREMEPD